MPQRQIRVNARERRVQTEITFLAAVMVGFLGGVHCLGMCGGIVGALTLGIDAQKQSRSSRYLIQVAYNLGRISSYVFAGALAGWLGKMALDLTGVNAAQKVLQVLAGLFMVALGLYLAGWWRGLVRVEQAGAKVWKRIQPLGKNLIPVRSLPGAFLLGMIWGWLPCGLVYTALIWSLASGGVLQGATLMAGFGLGTLPNLLLMGLFAGELTRFMHLPAVKYTAGMLVILLGIYQLLKALTLM
jgi:sulfite exporter TauE/SafE